MKFIRFLVISLLLACVNLVYGQDVSIPIGFYGSSSGGSSNLTLVQAVPCTNGSSGNYTCIADTSTTSLAIATGSKTFTVVTGGAGKFIPTLKLRAYSNANNANFMEGTITSYNSGTKALVLNITTTGGSGSPADWNLGPAASSTGNISTIVEADYASNPTAPSVPTDGGDTFITDCPLSSAGNGRLTFFSFPNTVSGRTQYLIKPASGASSAVYAEWSGAATASPLNVSCQALFANSSSNNFAALPIASTQTVLAIGGAYNRASAADTYSTLDVWNALLPSPDSSDGDQLFTQYIVNGVKSQYTLNGGVNLPSGTARSNLAGVVLYKSAVAGSFSGQTPTVFLSMTGANGTAVTVANLPINPQLALPSMAAAGDPNHCFTYDTSHGVASLTSNSTNGTVYLGNDTNSIAYNLGCNNATDNQITFGFLGAASGTVSAVVKLLYPNTGFTGDNFNIGGFVTAGTNTDRCYAFIESANGTNYDVKMENSLSDSASTIDVTALITGGVPLSITYQLTTTGGSPGCKMSVYNGNTGAQVGSEISNSIQTGSTATSWSFGRFDGGAGSGTAYFMKAAVDILNGTYPMKL